LDWNFDISKHWQKYSKLSISGKSNSRSTKLSTPYYLGVEPPFYVMLTMIGVKGYTMMENPSDFPLGEIPHGNPIDRDPLVLPEIMIDSFSTDIIEATKSIFDALWNAAGWPESRYLP
jgi:hypothetical protein